MDTLAPLPPVRKPPAFIQRAALAWDVPATEGVSHWRMRCPLCQGPHHAARMVREAPSLIFWERSSDSGWSYACYSGRLGCTQAKVRLALREASAHVGLCNGDHGETLDAVDSATLGVAKAQALWRATVAVEQGDPVDLYFRANGVTLYQQEARWIRRSVDLERGHALLVEALLDPCALVVDPEPTVLGVSLTFLQQNGTPVVVGTNGEVKKRTVGRHRGLATPIAQGWGWPKIEIDVAVGTVAALKSMRTFNGHKALAVAKTGDLGLVYAPMTGVETYRVAVPKSEAAWNVARGLLTEFERLGVRHDAWEGEG